MAGNTEFNLIKRMEAEVRRGRISRRDFMSHALAAGVSLSVASGIWSTSAMAAPKKGGLFRLGSHDGNTSDTHDPGTYLSFSIIQLAHTYRSYLTILGSEPGCEGMDLQDRQGCVLP